MKTILLDRVVLQNLYGDSHESMIEIFSEFLDSYSETKKALFSAFESGNLTSFKRVLHYHGPSFMYLGLPDVAAIFKNLEQKCLQADSHYSLSKDFAELMEVVEIGWIQAKNEIESIRNAVEP